jgi:hypothetical protein
MGRYLNRSGWRDSVPGLVCGTYGMIRQKRAGKKIAGNRNTDPSGK